MNIKNKYSNLIVLIVATCVYLLTCIIGDKYANFILAYSVIGIFIIRQKFRISKFLIWITILTIILIGITLRFNFINVILIILIYNIFNGDMGKETIILLVKTMVIYFIFIIMVYFVFNFNVNYDTAIWRNGILYSRHCLGYAHPNFAATKWLGIVMGLLLLIKPRKILRKISGILIITYTVYCLTYSRTSTVIIIYLCISIILLHKKIDKKVPYYVQFLIAITPIILTILSFEVTKYFYDSSLNCILSGRLLIYKNIIQQYNISLFGNSLIEDIMFDNAYIQILLSKGIIYSCLVAILFVYLIMHTKNMSYRSVLIISAYYIMALLETSFFRFELLIIVLLAVSLDSNKKVDINENQ